MKKRYLWAIMAVAILNLACFFVCEIPEEVRRAEELQFKQAKNINEYLRVIQKNPAIIIEPGFVKINIKIVSAASYALMKSIQAQLAWFNSPIFCSIPDEIIAAEELQHAEAVKINAFLEEITNLYPEIATNPYGGKLNAAIAESAELMENTKKQSKRLGHSEKFQGFDEEGGE
jgi:hypothetical protein